MNEKQTFIDQIKADPYDISTRRIFADWLEDHGFDEEVQFQREWTLEKRKAAEEYIKNFAAGCSQESERDESWVETTVDEIIEYAEKCLGTDSAGIWENGLCLPFSGHPRCDERFWEHFYLLTERPMDDRWKSKSWNGPKNFVHCAC